MRRQLKKVQLERDAAMEEIGSFQRKERAFALAKTQLEKAGRRLQDLEKRSMLREKQMREQSIAADAAHSRADALEATVATCASPPSHIHHAFTTRHKDKAARTYTSVLFGISVRAPLKFFVFNIKK